MKKPVEYDSIDRNSDRVPRDDILRGDVIDTCPTKLFDNYRYMTSQYEDDNRLLQ